MKKKKNRQDFESLTAEQLIQGINLVIDNADGLFRSASSLKNEGRYGLANSLYILCCEEAIKALVLFNFFLHDDDRKIDEILRSHKAKLDILKAGYHILSTDSLAMVLSYRQAELEQPGKSIEELRARAIEVNSVIKESMFSNYSSKEADDKWWDSADITKQQGFYVGLTGNNWCGPSDITQEQVEQTASKALLIMGHINIYRDIDVKRFRTGK